MACLSGFAYLVNHWFRFVSAVAILLLQKQPARQAKPDRQNFFSKNK
jgi:hypothetical protein